MPMSETQNNRIAIKRVYEPVAAGDGARVLVDRLWPRGITKRKAHVDLWLRDIAPSPELRKWFGHDPRRWRDFRRRYREELAEKQELLAELAELADRGPITLIYSAHDPTHNQACVLAEYLDPPLENGVSDADK
jgi:uncharacterized protein YeaO (DUF488 family)